MAAARLTIARRETPFADAESFGIRRHLTAIGCRQRV